jgi:hypothetical protein
MLTWLIVTIILFVTGTASSILGFLNKLEADNKIGIWIGGMLIVGGFWSAWVFYKFYIL